MQKKIDLLSSDDAAKRRSAAQALSQGDDRAIYPLIKALRDKSPGVQDAAMRSLIFIGGENVAYMVLPLLREDSYLRNTAILILNEIGPASVPLMYPLLKDKDEDIRKFSLDLMADIRVGVEPERILPCVKDPNANVRAAALRALGLLRYEHAVAFIAQALDDEEWVSFAALEALGEIGDDSIVAPVAKVLDTGSHALKMMAIETLGKLPTERSSEALKDFIVTAEGDEKAIALKALVHHGIAPTLAGMRDVLIQMVKEDPWDEKLVAIKGLVAIQDTAAIDDILDMAGTLDVSEPDQEEVLGALASLLEGYGCAEHFVEILKDPKIRYRAKSIAAHVLGTLKCHNAVPVITASLEKDERDMRRSAIDALGRMYNAPGVKDTLVKCIADHDSHIRKVSLMALGRLKGQDVFDALLARLGEEQYLDVKEEAVRALLAVDAERFLSHLTEFGSEIKEIVGRISDHVGALVQLVQDPEAEIRVAALGGLGALRSAHAMEHIKKATTDHDPAVRRAAVLALAEHECFPDDIKGLLHDDDMWVRLHAVRTLGRSMKQDLIETLTPMLKDDEVPVVMAAIEAISSVGGPDAFSALNDLRSHGDEGVRAAVEEALKRL